MKYSKWQLRDDIAEIYRKYNWHTNIVNTSFKFTDEILPLIEKYKDAEK